MVGLKNQEEKKDSLGSPKNQIILFDEKNMNFHFDEEKTILDKQKKKLEKKRRLQKKADLLREIRQAFQSASYNNSPESSELSKQIHWAFRFFHLSPENSFRDIKKRYYEKAFQLHPDRNQNNVSDEMTLCNRAFEILKKYFLIQEKENDNVKS